MGHGVVVRGGAYGAPVGPCLLHLRADSGKGGGDVVTGPCEYRARVADGEGDELQASSVFLVGLDKGGGISCSFLLS